MIKPEDTEDEKKKYKLNRTNYATGQVEEIELEFQDAVIELLGSIANSFAVMGQAAASRIQQPHRQYHIVDPTAGGAN